MLKVFAPAFLLLSCSIDVLSTPIDNGVEGDPEIECGPNTITVNFNTRNDFEGHVFVKGRYAESGCKSDQTGKRTASLSLPFSTCGVERQRSLNPRGLFVGVSVVITFHPQFLTKVDRAYSVQCFYMEADKTVSQDIEVSEITTDFQTQTVPMPVCRYDILDGGPNGEPVKFAAIGQQVYHKWTCVSETVDIFCMVVHSCYVDDGQANRNELLNDQGCALDRYVLNNLEYISDLVAGKESHVFKFADKPALQFQCQISIAVKEPGEQCPRPQCPEPEGFGSTGGPNVVPGVTTRGLGGTKGTNPPTRTQPSSQPTKQPTNTPGTAAPTLAARPKPTPIVLSPGSSAPIQPPEEKRAVALPAIADVRRTLPPAAPLLTEPNVKTIKPIQSQPPSSDFFIVPTPSFAVATSKNINPSSGANPSTVTNTVTAANPNTVTHPSAPTNPNIATHPNTIANPNTIKVNNPDTVTPTSGNHIASSIKLATTSNTVTPPTQKGSALPPVLIQSFSGNFIDHPGSVPTPVPSLAPSIALFDRSGPLLVSTPPLSPTITLVDRSSPNFVSAPSSSPSIAAVDRPSVGPPSAPSITLLQPINSTINRFIVEAKETESLKNKVQTLDQSTASVQLPVFTAIPTHSSTTAEVSTAGSTAGVSSTASAQTTIPSSKDQAKDSSHFILDFESPFPFQLTAPLFAAPVENPATPSTQRQLLSSTNPQSTASSGHPDVGASAIADDESFLAAATEINQTEPTDKIDNPAVARQSTPEINFATQSTGNPTSNGLIGRPGFATPGSQGPNPSPSPSPDNVQEEAVALSNNFPSLSTQLKSTNGSNIFLPQVPSVQANTENAIPPQSHFPQLADPSILSDPVTAKSGNDKINHNSSSSSLQTIKNAAQPADEFSGRIDFPIAPSAPWLSPFASPNATDNRSIAGTNLNISQVTKSSVNAATSDETTTTTTIKGSTNAKVQFGKKKTSTSSTTKQSPNSSASAPAPSPPGPPGINAPGLSAAPQSQTTTTKIPAKKPEPSHKASRFNFESTFPFDFSGKSGAKNFSGPSRPNFGSTFPAALSIPRHQSTPKIELNVTSSPPRSKSTSDFAKTQNHNTSDASTTHTRSESTAHPISVTSPTHFTSSKPKKAKSQLILQRGTLPTFAIKQVNFESNYPFDFVPPTNTFVYTPPTTLSTFPATPSSSISSSTPPFNGESSPTTNDQSVSTSNDLKLQLNDPSLDRGDIGSPASPRSLEPTTLINPNFPFDSAQPSLPNGLSAASLVLSTQSAIPRSINSTTPQPAVDFISNQLDILSNSQSSNDPQNNQSKSTDKISTRSQTPPRAPNQKIIQSENSNQGQQHDARFDFDSTWPFRLRRVRSSDRIVFAGTWDVKAPLISTYEDFDHELVPNEFGSFWNSREAGRLPLRAPESFLDNSKNLYCVSSVLISLILSVTILSFLASIILALLICLRRREKYYAD